MAAQGQWRRTTRPQVSEALFLLCLISSSSQVARPPAHATAPRPAQSPQVSREVCVCSGCSGSLASLMESASRSRRPPSSRSAQHSSQAFSGWFGGSDSEESSFRPDGMVRTFDVYLGPKDLDEKVSELHLPALGAELTVLTVVTQRSRMKAL